MFSNSGSVSYRFWRWLRANDDPRRSPPLLIRGEGGEQSALCALIFAQLLPQLTANGRRSGRTWRRSRASRRPGARSSVGLPSYYPPVGVGVGGTLAVEDKDARLIADAKRPTHLRFLRPQDLQQTAESRSPGLAGHDARICREAHGLVCRLVVNGNKEVDALGHGRPGDQ